MHAETPPSPFQEAFSGPMDGDFAADEEATTGDAVVRGQETAGL